MIDMSEWANGSHNSFGDAMYMAALSTVLVFAVLGVVWRAGASTGPHGRWTWAPSAGTVSSTRHPIRIGQPDASVRGDAWPSAKETEDES